MQWEPNQLNKDANDIYNPSSINQDLIQLVIVTLLKNA